MTLTPRELQRALEHKNEEDEFLLNLVKATVSAVRASTAHLHHITRAANSKNGTAPWIAPEKLIPMSWDKDHAEKSPEDWSAWFKTMRAAAIAEDKRKNETPEQRHARIENKRRNRRKRK